MMQNSNNIALIELHIICEFVVPCYFLIDQSLTRMIRTIQKLQSFSSPLLLSFVSPLIWTNASVKWKVQKVIIPVRSGHRIDIVLTLNLFIVETKGSLGILPSRTTSAPTTDSAAHGSCVTHT